MNEMILLEYNERDGGFHYNTMEYVSATRGYKAVSLCNYDLASKFTNEYRHRGLSFDEICQRWESYFNAHRNDFLKIGLK